MSIQLASFNLNQKHSYLNNLYIRSMITKDQVIQTVNDLPDNFSAEELIQKIILLDKIEIGLKQSETGKVVTNEEAKKRLAKWLA